MEHMGTDKLGKAPQVKQLEAEPRLEEEATLSLGMDRTVTALHLYSVRSPKHHLTVPRDPVLHPDHLCCGV